MYVKAQLLRKFYLHPALALPVYLLLLKKVKSCKFDDKQISSLVERISRNNVKYVNVLSFI